MAASALRKLANGARRVRYQPRTATLALGDTNPRLAGMEVTVRLDAPSGLLPELVSADQDRARAALATLVLDHNIDDADGAPLPDPGTEGFDAWPMDLVIAVSQGLGAALNDAAASVLPKDGSASSAST